jgi:hypothetical protein
MAGEVRLWDVDHPYYCNEGNFYANGTVQRYGSWLDFAAAEGDADLDMNLVFRWDWARRDEAAADPYYRAETLSLFYMGQRKGLYRCAIVDVCRADEPAIRAWLAVRWAHMQTLWAPFAVSPAAPPASVGAGGDE